NVTVDEVLEVADRVLVTAKEQALDRPVPAEPAEVFETYTEQVMPVAAPLFYVGYKYPMAEEYVDATSLLACETVLELLCGHGSRLYASLMEQGLINDSFGGEFFEGRGFALFLFGGESRDPKAVQQAIADEVKALCENGIEPDRFEEVKAALYGRLVRRFNNIETAATALMDDHFHDREPFAFMDAAKALTAADVVAVMQNGMKEAYRTLSVVHGEEGDA
ncbi:MAG: insulinase family protein, partial [Clostridia bacterium]|nr:insulinase family protein [Clostridia bacterium]